MPLSTFGMIWAHFRFFSVVPNVATYEGLMACMVVSGLCTGGIPTNLPLVFRESFPNHYDSSLGIANVGRGLAAIAFGASFRKQHVFTTQYFINILSGNFFRQRPSKDKMLLAIFVVLTHNSQFHGDKAQRK